MIGVDTTGTCMTAIVVFIIVLTVLTCRPMMMAATASSSALVVPNAGTSLLAIHHWAVAPVGMPEVAAVRGTCRPRGASCCCTGLSMKRVVLDILLTPREDCL